MTGKSDTVEVNKCSTFILNAHKIESDQNETACCWSFTAIYRCIHPFTCLDILVIFVRLDLLTEFTNLVIAEAILRQK